MFGRKFLDETRSMHSTPLDLKHCAAAVGPRCSIEFWGPETQTTTRVRSAPKRNNRIHTAINCCRSNPCTNGHSRHHRPVVAVCKKDDRFSAEPKCCNAPHRSPRPAFTKRTVDGAIAAARELHRCLSDECSSLGLRGASDNRFSSFKSNCASAGAKSAAADSRLDWLCRDGIDDDNENDPCEFLKWCEYDPAPVRIRSSDCRRVGGRSSSFKTAAHKSRDPCHDTASSFRTAASKEHLRCLGLGHLERKHSDARSLRAQESASGTEHFWNEMWDNIQPTEDMKGETVDMLRQIAGQLIQDFIRKIKQELEAANAKDLRRAGKKGKKSHEGKEKTALLAAADAADDDVQKGGSSLSLPTKLSRHKAKPDAARTLPKSNKGKEPKDKSGGARKPEHKAPVRAAEANKGKKREEDTDETGKSGASAPSSDGEKGTGTSNDDAGKSAKKVPDKDDKAGKKTTGEEGGTTTEAQEETEDDSKKRRKSSGAGEGSDARRTSGRSSGENESYSSTKSSASTRSTSSTASSSHRLHDAKRKKKGPAILLREQQQQQQQETGPGKQSVLYIEKTETIKYHSAPPSAKPKDGPAPNKSDSGGHHSGGGGAGGGAGGGGSKEHASLADSDQQHTTKNASHHKKTGKMEKAAASGKRKEPTSHESDRTTDDKLHDALQDLIIDPAAEETLKTFATDIVQSLYTAIQYKLRNLIRDSRDEKLKHEIMERGEFELKNHILPTFIEHIVWIIKKEFSGQTAVQLKQAMEHDPGQYIDTVVTNAVMKTHSDLEAKSPRLKAFVVMSNCKSAGKRAL